MGNGMASIVEMIDASNISHYWSNRIDQKALSVRGLSLASCSLILILEILCIALIVVTSLEVCSCCGNNSYQATVQPVRSDFAQTPQVVEQQTVAATPNVLYVNQYGQPVNQFGQPLFQAPPFTGQPRTTTVVTTVPQNTTFQVPAATMNCTMNCNVPA